MVHLSSLRKLLGPQTIATLRGTRYRFTLTLASPAKDSAHSQRRFYLTTPQ